MAFSFWRRSSSSTCCIWAQSLRNPSTSQPSTLAGSRRNQSRSAQSLGNAFNEPPSHSWVLTFRRRATVPTGGKKRRGLVQQLNNTLFFVLRSVTRRCRISGMSFLFIISSLTKQMSTQTSSILPRTARRPTRSASGVTLSGLEMVFRGLGVLGDRLQSFGAWDFFVISVAGSCRQLRFGERLGDDWKFVPMDCKGPGDLSSSNFLFFCPFSSWCGPTSLSLPFSRCVTRLCFDIRATASSWTRFVWYDASQKFVELVVGAIWATSCSDIRSFGLSLGRLGLDRGLGVEGGEFSGELRWRSSS